jgi:hypothetical protein
MPVILTCNFAAVRSACHHTEPCSLRESFLQLAGLHGAGAVQRWDQGFRAGSPMPSPETAAPAFQFGDVVVGWLDENLRNLMPDRPGHSTLWPAAWASGFLAQNGMESGQQPASDGHSDPRDGPQMISSPEASPAIGAESCRQAFDGESEPQPINSHIAVGEKGMAVSNCSLVAETTWEK